MRSEKEVLNSDASLSMNNSNLDERMPKRYALAFSLVEPPDQPIRIHNYTKSRTAAYV